MSELDWRDGSIPVSMRFDDPYYSVEDGRAETNHVFLQGNDLPARWPCMQQCTIAELGFGTGLNFLETVWQWQKKRQPGQSLHFISFEQFPLNTSEIRRALAIWTDLEEHATHFEKLWEPAGGLLDTDFAENIRLTVWFGDANETLAKCLFEADAWYLDGFAPAKNPQLWNLELMKAVAEHTVADGTFSTYSAAGFVRRNLQDAGFIVEKCAGFGRKRNMLKGVRARDTNVADRY